MCIDAAVDEQPPVEAISIEECSRKCFDIASHFAYGTNDFGGHGCQDGFCKCHCIERCQQLDQDSYWFFRYKPGASLAMEGDLIQFFLINQNYDKNLYM